ncbi:putative FY-rich, FY-rich, WD40/YVTN repeat-like-containing domain protein [Tanacetum coccineum]
MLVWGEADSETSPKRSLRRKLFKTCCMNWGEVNPTHAYYNGSCTIKDTEDPSWSTSFKTRRTQKTSSALEALWKTLFVLYLYLIGTLIRNLIEGKERHPYPVGYVAHRNNSGNTYKMMIIEGLKGPEFVISSTDGQSCSGQTPDIAWEGFQKKGCVRIKFWRGKIFMQDRWCRGGYTGSFLHSHH